MNHLQYHLDNRFNINFANSKPSELPSKPLLQMAPHQIAVGAKLFYVQTTKLAPIYRSL